MEKQLSGESLKDSEEIRELLMKQLRLVSELSDFVSSKDLFLLSKAMCELADKIQIYL